MKRLLIVVLISCFLVSAASAATVIVYSNDTATGYLQYSDTVSFLSARSHDGSSATTWNDGSVRAALSDSTDTTNVDWLARGVAVYNTSVVPDTATISAAVVGVDTAGVSDVSLGDTGVGITKFVIAGSIDATDYNNFQDTRYSSDKTISTMTGSNNWSLNAAGLSNISKTGETGFMFRTTWDIDNTSPSLTGTDGYYTMWQGYTAEGAITFLEITYATETAPVTAFSANTTSGVTPLAVGFTDSSSNTPTDWDWYWFANETKSSDLQNPTTSLTTGLYNVRLYSSNGAGGDWENKTAYINVTAGTVAPTAAFSANVTSGTTPLNVGFTDSSTDVPTNWDWYWSDDEVKDSDLQNPTVALTTGTYNVRLYVSNAAGGDWENKTTYITVTPVPPVAAFSADATTGGVRFVVFTDASTNTPTNWDWYWSADEVKDSDSQNPTASFAEGTYNVRLYVSNAGGGDWENKTGYITASVAPVAAFTADATSGSSPLSVAFTDGTTHTPTNWDWYWYANETKSSDLQNPTTSLTRGTYNVRLYVSNTQGGDWENKTGYIVVGRTIPAPLPTMTYFSEYIDPFTADAWNLSAQGQIMTSAFGAPFGANGTLIVMGIWIFMVLVIIGVRQDSFAIPFVLFCVIANLGLFIPGIVPQEWMWSWTVLFMALPAAGFLYILFRGSR